LYAAVAALVVGVAGGVALARDARMVARSGSRAGDRAERGRVTAAPRTDDVESPPAADGGVPLVVVDRAGRPVRGIPASRPWTPRFSPDGRQVVYGAFGAGRSTSDLWVADVDAGTRRRLTDDDADANDPQWSPDGRLVAYSAGAPDGKDLLARPIAGGAPRVLAARAGTQFASDWSRDGRALLVTEEAGENGHDILVQPADGSPARPYAATRADETGARVSPDGRWVAYTSDASGRPEVYLDAYPRPGRRVRVSSGGGLHPVWRGDGRELYYWRDGTLVAAPVRAGTPGTPPGAGGEVALFRAAYPGGPNAMYDASPDGQRFVMVRGR
jgi:dipeptidyl aminopeptidase/acylaminoacyl peptidase